MHSVTSRKSPLIALSAPLTPKTHCNFRASLSSLNGVGDSPKSPKHHRPINFLGNFCANPFGEPDLARQSDSATHRSIWLEPTWTIVVCHPVEDHGTLLLMRGKLPLLKRGRRHLLGKAKARAKRLHLRYRSTTPTARGSPLIPRLHSLSLRMTNLCNPSERRFVPEFAKIRVGSQMPPILLLIQRQLRHKSGSSATCLRSSSPATQHAKG
uniref:Uncharacterized protein n=1 Tax=Solanum tuberosum TaxID=4113 RepID=M1D8Q8_SOLTU